MLSLKGDLVFTTQISARMQTQTRTQLPAEEEAVAPAVSMCACQVVYF